MTSPSSSVSTRPSLRNCNSLTRGYTKNGSFSVSVGTQKPDEFTLASLLKASSTLSDPSTVGRRLHAKSIRTGLSADPGTRASLVAMYSSSGLLDSARKVFDEVPWSENHDAPSWNSIISACASHGQYAESFRMFSAMTHVENLVPTVATYIIVLGACTAMQGIEIGRVLHARMIKERVVDEVRALNSLITLYSKCGALRDARKVFEYAKDGMNVVAWNAMIAGYEQNGEFERALHLFGGLSGEQVLVKANRITFLSAMSAVSAISDLRLGKEVHAQIVRTGLECEVSIGNSLVTMYGKCGEVQKARMVFDGMLVRDVITWNSMLTGYAQNEQLEACCRLFREMQIMGIEPDDHTLTVLLSAAPFGREIHWYLLRKSVRKVLNVPICNAIVTNYAKNSRLGDAEKIFKGMRQRDSHSWNAMMDGYSMNGRFDEAIKLFVDLLEQDIEFDCLTLSIVLTACGRLVSIESGKQFHGLTLKHQHNLCKSNETSLLSINNALVSMYCKCGSISDATKVFYKMRKRDVFSWTAIITGYAHQGMGNESLHLFETMRMEGIKPNLVTFLSLLTACAHSGLVKEGVRYFDLMTKVYCIEPSVEHCACMVDLFGRAGQFERAEAMVIKHGSSLTLWKVLLGACHAHKQLELGKRAAAKILEVDHEDETTHVLLSNLYASFGLWRDAIDVRKQMRERGLSKEAGCSWVEIRNKKHVFVAADVSHPNRNEIYGKLRELDRKCRGIGYVPMTDHVLHDVEEVQKEEILSWHSERLALSYAILKTRSARGVIRVVKNLRVCRDCHNWIKFASQVEGRELVLRDSRRFHSFKDGKCSCGDYW